MDHDLAYRLVAVARVVERPSSSIEVRQLELIGVVAGS